MTRQIDPLGNPLAEPMLERTLGSLPTLDRTYSWALEGIPPPNLESAIRLLQFLTFSRRPLLIEEAVDAIAIDLNRDPFFDPSYRVPHLTETLQLCSSLVRKVLQTTARSASSHSMLPEAKTKLQLAHPSVKEYFLSSRISSRFKPYFDPVAAETSIERACRAYLLQIDYGSREMFPFVEYSAMYRFDANSTADRHDIAAVELLEKTLPTRSIRNWFRLFDENDLGDHEYWFRSDVVASPLYYCARAGFFRAVRYLLDHGAEINSKGGFYGNALRAAIVRRHEKVVQILLDGGVDVNAHEAHHSSPLIAASNLGWDKIVRALLEKGADVNKRGEVYGGPLQAAAFRGHSRTLQVLLDYGADVDAQGGLYGNALQAASANGHEKIVQMLLDKDANTHSRYESLSGATTAASQMQQQNVADVISGRVVAPRVRRAVPVEGILQRYHQQIMSLEVGPSPPPLLRMPSNLEDGYIG